MHRLFRRSVRIPLAQLSRFDVIREEYDSSWVLLFGPTDGDVRERLVVLTCDGESISVDRNAVALWFGGKLSPATYARKLNNELVNWRARDEHDGVDE